MSVAFPEGRESANGNCSDPNPPNLRGLYLLYSIQRFGFQVFDGVFDFAFVFLCTFNMFGKTDERLFAGVVGKGFHELAFDTFFIDEYLSLDGAADGQHAAIRQGGADGAHETGGPFFHRYSLQTADQLWVATTPCRCG